MSRSANPRARHEGAAAVLRIGGRIQRSPLSSWKPFHPVSCAISVSLLHTVVVRQGGVQADWCKSNRCSSDSQEEQDDRRSWRRQRSIAQPCVRHCYLVPDMSPWQGLCAAQGIGLYNGHLSMFRHCEAGNRPMLALHDYPITKLDRWLPTRIAHYSMGSIQTPRT